MDEKSLRSVPLFDSLSKGDRRAIAQHTDEVDAPEGTELVRQGDFAYEFFVIEEGTAQVVRDGRLVAELGPGDFLGEMGIVGHTVRNASVTTITPVRALVMSEQALRSMRASNPTIADRITAAVEERRAALPD